MKLFASKVGFAVKVGLVRFTQRWFVNCRYLSGKVGGKSSFTSESTNASQRAANNHIGTELLILAPGKVGAFKRLAGRRGWVR